MYNYKKRSIVLNIVTALKIEANPIIEHFKLKCENGIYKNEKINLIITGQGKIKSAVNTALLLNSHNFPTLNFGICGSNKYDINRGFFIHKIIDTDTSFEYYPDYFKNNSEVLHTVSQINDYYPLVDMEGSGFFEACYKFLNVNEIILYKIVSDTPATPLKTDMIPELIKSHIHIIEEIISNLKSNDIFKEIEILLYEASNKMHLTATQKNQLKLIFTLYKIKNKKIPNIPILTKKEKVKNFITSLISSLEI